MRWLSSLCVTPSHVNNLTNKKLTNISNTTEFNSSPIKAEGGRRLQPGLLSNSQNIAPIISIITVVYNGAEQLRSTIISVIEQENNKIEYIVIDGGSTDRTVDILRDYDDRIDYWTTERDAGIYDAMNKGISLARGKFIYHLNIGDQLLKIPTILFEPISEEIVCVAGVVQTAPGKFHRPSVGIELRLHNTLHHQGCFYRRNDILSYDLAFRVFSDFDLNQRLVKSGGKIMLCTDLVAIHDTAGISHTTNRFWENYQIIRKNYGILWVLLAFSYFKIKGTLKRLGIS